MSPAFSHCFLKRLSAFSKLSSGSTITLVTRSSPLSFLPEALPVYHAPIGLATHAPLGVTGAQPLHPYSLSREGREGCPPWTTLSRVPRDHSGEPRYRARAFDNTQKIRVQGEHPSRPSLLVVAHSQTSETRHLLRAS